MGGFVQKDLGSALILAFLCMMMFFITPRPYYKRFKTLALILLVIGVVVVVFSATVILKPHQLGRIYTWLNPSIMHHIESTNCSLNEEQSNLISFP